MTQQEPLVQVRELGVRFASPEGTVMAVNGIDLDVGHGETLAVLGESGCGKSVAMQAVMGLVRSPPGTVEARSIRFDGIELVGAAATLRRRLRGARMAMIFQDPFTALDPTQTVGRQIGEMFRVHRGSSAASARRAAIELMERVRIPSAVQRVDDYPHQFSGGMSQRILIAAAIALGPDLLIADEPTTALDVTVQAQIMTLLRGLREASGMAMILITHDLGLAAENANRAAVLYAGRVVETGPMATLYRRPAHPYTIGLVRSLPELKRKTARLQPIEGAPPRLTRLPPGCAFAPRCRWRQEICTRVRPALQDVVPGHGAACHFAGDLAP